MGNLRGDLSVLGIANLLQALAFSRCEGILTFELGTQPRVFYLHASGIRLVRGSRRCQRLEKLLRTAGSRGAPPSARLVREWVLDEISELSTWTRGTFRFQEASELPERAQILQGPLASFEPDGDLMSLILEAARRADEMPRLRAAISDIESVPEQNGSPISLDDAMDPEALADLLALVDGRRSVSAILQESAFPRFTVLHVLSRLAAREAIRIPQPSAAPSAA